MDSNPALDRLVAIIDLQNQIAAGRLDADSVRGLIVERAMDMTPANGAVITMRDGDEFVYETVIGVYEPHKGMRRSATKGLTALAARTGESFRCEDTQTDMRVDRDLCNRLGIRALVVVPFQRDDELVGTLQVCSPKPRAFGEGDVQTLQLLSGLVGAALEQADRLAAAAGEATWDKLTDLGNHKAYQHRLGGEVARSLRYAVPTSLVILDVDGLDFVNERYGHLEGDAVLRRVSSLMRQTRAADECFRIGADTFAILMPNTTQDGAELAATRIRNLVTAADLCDGAISMNYGVTQLSGEDPQAFHAEAFDALYEAKLLRSQQRALRASGSDAG